jgi:hypothetical protein
MKVRTCDSSWAVPHLDLLCCQVCLGERVVDVRGAHSARGVNIPEVQGRQRQQQDQLWDAD